jgi:sec-independent protein translocase protein TatA
MTDGPSFDGPLCERSTMTATALFATTSDVFVLAFGWPGGTEWIVLLVLGLLIFGRRLPEVGRSLGKGIVEFKRGIKGIDDEIKGIDDDIKAESSRPASRPAALEDHPAPGSVSGTAEVTANPYDRSGD